MQAPTLTAVPDEYTDVISGANSKDTRDKKRGRDIRPILDESNFFYFQLKTDKASFTLDYARSPARTRTEN